MVLVSVQPLVLVNVTVAVPTETPVTTPFGVTVATFVFEDTQALDNAGVVVAVKFVVSPAPTDIVPEITGT